MRRFTATKICAVRFARDAENPDDSPHGYREYDSQSEEGQRLNPRSPRAPGRNGHWELVALERGKQGASRELLGKLMEALGLSLAEGVAEATNVGMAPQPDRLYRYPVVSAVEAGGWVEAVQPYEPGAEDTFELTDYQARGPAFWLRVSGDSMTSPTPPSIPEGHLILVDTGLTPSPGDLVVAKLDNENTATFKRLVSDAGQLYLKPLNSSYRMIPIDGSCRLIGVVKEAKVKL